MKMNAFLLIIPFLLVRFSLLSFVKKGAIKRAAYFAPVRGNERIAYLVYQISNIAIFVYLFFLKVVIVFSWNFYIGLSFYLLGLILCGVTIVNFATPSQEGLNVNGIYKFSRNPMYIAYFIYFIGCAFLTGSWILFGIILIFQIATHWIILSEERWCLERFGESYAQYMKKVRRYI